MELVDRQLEEIGPVNKGELGVAVILSIAAICWIFRSQKAVGTVNIPGLNMLFPWIDDSTIAILASVALFLWPVDPGRGEFVLNWESAKEIPWGILLLFGGGLSLAAAVHSTGLDMWIGYMLAGLKDIPVLVIIFAVVTLGVCLSELTSNTATSTTLMPILASVAMVIGQDPRLLMIPAAIACSCAFLLPVATPPNAIVFGAGYIRLPQMIKAGIIFEIAGMILVTLLSYLLIGLAFAVHTGTLPQWAIHA
jgi:sodium-dependent dicarboxylate transporter 2/3/5